jgi:hypothetical protein
MGKTTIALSVLHADSVKQRYPRRFFVSCETVTSIDLLLSEIADVLHIPASKRDAALYDTILHFLSEERTIVCFDNFETLWAVAKSSGKFGDMLERLDRIPTLSILMTMRGTERPSSIRWSRPLFPPLSALSFDHTKEIYINLTKQYYDDSAELLLKEVGGVPLAATLLASQVQDGQSSKLLWKRWEREKTSILETGRRDRLSSLDISIQLSIDSPLLKDVPYAVQILSMISSLPTGLPEESPLMDSLEKNMLENVSLYHAIQALQRVALVYLDRDSNTNRFRILPPIRQYCLTQLSSDPELKKVLSLTYVHFINENCNFWDPSLQNIVPSELMNLHDILLAIFEDTDINNPDVFAAAASYAGWCQYLGLNIDRVIRLAIGIVGDGEDSALTGVLSHTYGAQHDMSDFIRTLIKGRAERIVADKDGLYTAQKGVSDTVATSSMAETWPRQNGGQPRNTYPATLYILPFVDTDLGDSLSGNTGHASPQSKPIIIPQVFVASKALKHLEDVSANLFHLITESDQHLAYTPQAGFNEELLECGGGFLEEIYIIIHSERPWFITRRASENEELQEIDPNFLSKLSEILSPFSAYIETEDSIFTVPILDGDGSVMSMFDFIRRDASPYPEFVKKDSVREQFLQAHGGEDGSIPPPVSPDTRGQSGQSNTGNLPSTSLNDNISSGGSGSDPDRGPRTARGSDPPPQEPPAPATAPNPPRNTHTSAPEDVSPDPSPDPAPTKTQRVPQFMFQIMSKVYLGSKPTTSPPDVRVLVSGSVVSEVRFD